MPAVLLHPATAVLFGVGCVAQALAIKIALSVAASALMAQRVVRRPVAAQPVAAGSLSIDAGAADSIEDVDDSADAAPTNETVTELNNEEAAAAPAVAPEEEVPATTVATTATAPTVPFPVVLLPPNPPVNEVKYETVPPRGAQAVFLEDGHHKKNESEYDVHAYAAPTIAAASAPAVVCEPGLAFAAPTAAAKSGMVETNGPTVMNESFSSPTTPTPVQIYDHRHQFATVPPPSDGASPPAAGKIMDSVQQPPCIADESFSPTPNPPPQVHPQEGVLVDPSSSTEASDVSSDEASNANEAATNIASLLPAGDAVPPTAAAPPVLFLGEAFLPRPEPRYNFGVQYTTYRRDADSDDDTDAESVEEEIDYSDPQDDQPYLFGANVLPEGFTMLGKRKFESDCIGYAAVPESTQGPDGSSAQATVAAAKEEEDVDEPLPPSKRQRKSPPAKAAAAPPAVAAPEAHQAKPKASKKSSRSSAAPKRSSAAPKRSSAAPKRCSARAQAAAPPAATSKPSSKVVATKVVEVDTKKKSPRVSAAAAKRRGAAVSAAPNSTAPSPKPASKKGTAKPRASAKRSHAEHVESSERPLVAVDAQQQPTKKARRTK